MPIHDINVKNAVYTHLNDKIAQNCTTKTANIRNGIFSCARQRALQLKIQVLIFAVLVVQFCAILPLTCL